MGKEERWRSDARCGGVYNLICCERVCTYIASFELMPKSPPPSLPPSPPPPLGRGDL